MEALREPPRRAPAHDPHVSPPTGPGSEPWRRDGAEWDRLEPTTLYGRRLRTPFLYLVTALLFPVACVLALPVALANLVVHRSLAQVLFCQERVGRRGRVFTLYKFRTMRGVPGEGSDVQRVTAFGRFLRNTHLDELPQFLNVLRGDMALIGPRPEMLEIEAWAAERLPRFSERLVLRPGLTGWAQITQGYAANGDEVAYARKLAINTSYRDELSLVTDVRILARTVLWMLLRRGWQPASVFERAAEPVNRAA